MPCLNEADTLESCIRAAQQALAEHQICDEIVVADNGSTDGSQQIAERIGVLSLCVLTFPLYRGSVNIARQMHRWHAPQLSEFSSRVAALPGDHIIVFVKYSPYPDPDYTLIANGPDLRTARAWIVYDRGLDDRRLIRLASNRISYRYDESTRTFSLIDTARLTGFSDTGSVTQIPEHHASSDSPLRANKADIK
jgi:glycosyltransferase involved in cell wall biosynthesis